MKTNTEYDDREKKTQKLSEVLFIWKSDLKWNFDILFYFLFQIMQIFFSFFLQFFVLASNSFFLLLFFISYLPFHYIDRWTLVIYWYTLRLKLY